MIAGMILWFSLSLGMQNGNTYVDYRQYELPQYFAQIELHAENEYLDVYTRYVNEMNKADSFMFSPVTDYFTVGSKLSYKNISLSVEHQCIHPVISSGEHGNIQGGYNKLWLTVTSKDI